MHTEKGREFALAKLQERRQTKSPQVDNSRLPAGSPMYFYCHSCGHLAAKLPEMFLGRPPRLCEECEALKSLDWLE